MSHVDDGQGLTDMKTQHLVPGTQLVSDHVEY